MAKIDNPADAMADILKSYTKMRNSENTLKTKILLERLRRKQSMQDYVAKKRLQDDSALERGKALIDYRTGRELQMKSLEEPAYMSDETVGAYTEETGEPRMQAGEMVSPMPQTGSPIPMKSNFKKFRLGILQRADQLAREGKRPELTEKQKGEMSSLREELLGPKGELQPSTRTWRVSPDGKTRTLNIWNASKQEFVPTQMTEPVKTTQKADINSVIDSINSINIEEE